MKIGVLKERKLDEKRVSLRPIQAGKLIKQGHQVFIEKGAGKLAKYSDALYSEMGANLTDKKTILENCKLILRVKEPEIDEYDDYKNHHILFSYLHFYEDLECVQELQECIAIGFLGIAYEWVGIKGNYPLLAPMSKISGHLFYQRAVELLAQHKGILARRYSQDMAGASILIIGIGNMGREVLKCSLLNRLNIFVVARSTQQVIHEINQIYHDFLGIQKSSYMPNVIIFDNDNPNQCKAEITSLMPKLDIIINCAVRRENLPKSKLEYLIDRNMVKMMESGSVVCDATAQRYDFIETCGLPVNKSDGNYLYDKLDSYEVIDGVIHCNTAHIPSRTPKTATDLLTNATFEYIEAIANKGIEEAIKSNEYLRNGVSCYRGHITHRATAERNEIEYVDIMNLLS